MTSRAENPGHGAIMSCRSADLPVRSSFMSGPGGPRSAELSSHQSVAGDHLFVERGAELGRAFQGLIVDIMQPEADRVALEPFEIVQQAPDEIAAHRHALGSGATQLGEV